MLAAKMSTSGVDVRRINGVELYFVERRQQYELNICAFSYTPNLSPPAI